MVGVTINGMLNNGFAGNYARQPDMYIDTKPNNGGTPIMFGSPLMVVAGATAADMGVGMATAALTAENFIGVAGAEIKTVAVYTDQNMGGRYEPLEPVSVFERGNISVLCPEGDPTPGGPVYVRIADSGGLTIGGFAAAETASQTVLLTNADLVF